MSLVYGEEQRKAESGESGSGVVGLKPRSVIRVGGGTLAHSVVYLRAKAGGARRAHCGMAPGALAREAASLGQNCLAAVFFF